MNAVLFIVLYGSEASIRRGLSSTLPSMQSGAPVRVFNNSYPYWPDGFVDELSQQYGFASVDSAGQNIGFAKAASILHEKYPADITLWIEGDSVTNTPAWDVPLINAVASGGCVWATLRNRRSYEEMEERGHYHAQVGGYNVTVPLQPCVNSICAVSTQWLEPNIGNVNENDYYGGSEVKLWDKLDQHSNRRWVYLDDYEEVFKGDLPNLDDALYIQYKYAHAIGGDRYKGSFEQYIKEHG
jgi:hypothetical protein